MKILYIGESNSHIQYLQGNVPSHWLYGACEMEREGHDVIWIKEEHPLLYDIRQVFKFHPDIIFIPNLNISHHRFLLLCLSLHLLRIPLYAYLHHEPQNRNVFFLLLYKFMLRGVKHIFFLSELTMKNVIIRGLVTERVCSVPRWGADSSFYKGTSICDKGYFVSTGKENRDFDILIEAFRITGAPLKIVTAKCHAGLNYESLFEKCKLIPNISVQLIENTSESYPSLLKLMAESKAIVCPLLRNRLNYCVGLSTIADAEALHKPLIITKNPYHSSSRMRYFNVVDSIEDWIKAINRIQIVSVDEIKSDYSMQKAYFDMCKYMFN